MFYIKLIALMKKIFSNHSFSLISSFAFISVFILLPVTSCKHENRKNDIDQKTVNENKYKDQKFLMVTIPSDIVATRGRADYLVTHYWDNFDFADTSYIHLPDITEVAFVNYIDALPHATKDIAWNSQKALLAKTKTELTGKMYLYFLSEFEKYLYDVNSPFRNEEYYLPIAAFVIADDRSDEVQKERMKFRRDMMLKNRIGTIASDIIYTLASGKTDKLSRINSTYTLLMFYNPDCHACEEIIAYLKSSEVINKAQTKGILKVFTFYPDKDIQIWKKHLPDIPLSWINGYDKDQIIENKKIYDLKAIPTLYLLDKEKKVLLKDADIRMIERYLIEKNLLTLSQ